MTLLIQFTETGDLFFYERETKLNDLCELSLTEGVKLALSIIPNLDESLDLRKSALGTLHSLWVQKKLPKELDIKYAELLMLGDKQLKLGLALLAPNRDLITMLFSHN